jgi:hypothetical protein
MQKNRLGNFPTRFIIEPVFVNYSVTSSTTSCVSATFANGSRLR